MAKVRKGAKTTKGNVKSAGVKKRIGKATKEGSSKLMDVDQDDRPEVAAANEINKENKQAQSRRNRKEAIAAQAARRRAQEGAAKGKGATETPFSLRRMLEGPKPKITGARMISEIEAAREHAKRMRMEQEIQAVSSPATTLPAQKGRRQKQRPNRLSRHSRQVLAAHHAVVEPVLFPRT
mmetsp:Transcript_12759/g.28743  ORF Transcript_12759/g.28743 Transcript_12759/m.28743 type:complete len:180 (-) Transcript_12759:29-568(-)